MLLTHGVAGVLTATQVLDKGNDVFVDSVPLAILNFGVVAAVVFLDQANGIQENDGVVCNFHYSVDLAKVVGVALTSNRGDVVTLSTKGNVVVPWNKVHGRVRV